MALENPELQKSQGQGTQQLHVMTLAINLTEIIKSIKNVVGPLTDDEDSWNFLSSCSFNLLKAISCVVCRSGLCSKRCI